MFCFALFLNTVQLQRKNVLLLLHFFSICFVLMGVCPFINWMSVSSSSSSLHYVLCVFSVYLQERDKVIPLIIQGFKDASEEAGTSVTGGQTVLNPWIVMGGVATTVCQPNEFIM